MMPLTEVPVLSASLCRTVAGYKQDVLLMNIN